FGTNKVFVVPDRPETGPMRNAPWQQIRFTPELFNGMLEQCPSIKNFTRTTQSSGTATFGAASQDNVRIVGIEPAWHQIEKRGIILGRPFSMIDNEQARPVCLINAKLQNKLGLARDCTGSDIIVGDRRYMVIGV